MDLNISAEELASELRSEEPPVLLDVREAHERTLSRLANDKHIPLGELPARFGELDPCSDLVVYCRVGMRSEAAVQFLRSKGFSRVRNLVAGINGWAREIDHSMRTY